MIVWPAGVLTENRARFRGSAAAAAVSASAWGCRADVIFESLWISALYSSAAFLSCSSPASLLGFAAERGGGSEGFPVL